MRFNQLTIVGYLGQNAEARTTQSGDTVTSFSVGVSGWKRDSPTTWFRCSWWGERGQKVAGYMEKGKPVLVVGEVSVREFEGRDGKARASLEVRVSDVQLLGGREDGGGERRPAPLPAGATDDDDVPF